jgi:hypothetical protein
VFVEHKPTAHSITQERPAIGVIEAISAGFDAVFHRPWLTLPPIALDLFLWIGPRLQAARLYDQLAPNFQRLAADLDANQVFALQQMRQMVQSFFATFNLFSWLSVGVFGVPAVNTNIDATAKLVTGAAPQLISVNSLDVYLVLTIGLSALGLFIAGLFWAILSGPPRGEAFDLVRWLQQGAAIGLKLVLFGAILIFSALMAFIPISFVMLLISTFSAELAGLMPALLLTAFVWAVFYCVFTAHGLALYHQPLTKAMRTSALIGRAFFAPTLGLIVLSVAIYFGLGLIWDNFDPSSWLRVIAVIGNAFVATGLAMASLVYYQNRSAILFDRLHWPQPLGS